MKWDYLGNELVVDLLANDIATGNFHQAYLLVGAPGVGRRTLAIRIAQSLNCANPPTPGLACYRCRPCEQIEKMSYADLSIIQAERVGGTLKVDQVRELQSKLALAPFEAHYRVAVLLRFEEAHISAMNAILKTLEEPGPQVVLILTAQYAESLLPTIVSRCEVLYLLTMAQDKLSRELQGHYGIPPEKAHLYAHLSGGRPGVAIRCLTEPKLLEDRQIWLDDHGKLISSDLVERFGYAENMAKNREVSLSALDIWLSLWRDVMLKACNASVPFTNPDLAEEILRLAEYSGFQTAYQMVRSLENTIRMAGRNVNFRLALEALLLDLPFIKP